MVVDSKSLGVSKARELAIRLQNKALSYATLVECRRIDSVEVVVFDVEVELSQVAVHDIRNVERIAAVFTATDRSAPEVLALRSDFPRAPHQNLRKQDIPRSLCLFEQPYREIRPQWTVPMFVERIRTWLRLTSRGELHAHDQPLEPLLLENILGTLVVPHELLFGGVAAAYPLSITSVATVNNELIVIADRADGSTDPAQLGNTGFIALSVALPPRVQSAIGHTPQTLLELHEMLSDVGVDLLSILRKSVSDWSGIPAALRSKLLIVLSAPKLRAEGSAVEATDAWTFATLQTVGEIGVGIGVLASHEGVLAGLLAPDLNLKGADVSLGLLNTVQSLSRDAAAHLNGYDAPSDLVMVGIGCGALGSQVVENAARAGFGRWTLIDNDVLLPHNLARHARDSASVGQSKSHAVAAAAKAITKPEGPFGSLDADFLEPGAHRETIEQSIKSADCIVDLSASLSVARRVSGIEGDARRISIFLNPTGTDLVLLAEDKDRKCTLDSLEAQYYRFLIRDSSLSGHLRPPLERIRYGRSCRDVTMRIPQANVAMFAGIAANALRAATETSEASMIIWRSQPSGAIEVHRTTAHPQTAWKLGDWTLVADQGILDIIGQLRGEKLPKETGGVLLGWFDNEEKTVRIVETIASPPDSKEWPTLYIRGCKGLPKLVDAATAASGEQVHYVGEWHSHPDGHTCDPSSDDMKVFGWLAEHMDEHGLPAVMMIVGEENQFAAFIGRMALASDASVNNTKAPSVAQSPEASALNLQ